MDGKKQRSLDSKPDVNNLKLNKLNFYAQQGDRFKRTSCVIAHVPNLVVNPGKDIKVNDTKPPSSHHFCYWYPELFGIDEEFMPSEDVEGVFEELFNNEELEERANALTKSQLNELRVGSREDMSDQDLRNQWKKDQVPMYGRRARAKPILQKKNREEYECLCDIDKSFNRHYVPHFGGGVPREGEDFRTPHFVAFWENMRERSTHTSDMDAWAKVLEPKKQEEPPQEMGLLFRPLPKFPGSGKKEMKKFREQLAASFRPLDCREIRRFRMPFSEALYLELQEDRYFESAQFFKSLLIKDYLRSKSLADYVLTLTVHKSRMKTLIEFLKISEIFSRRKEHHKESIILLKSGKYFNDHSRDWWWIAEEFYKKAVRVSRKSIIDGGKAEAVARYILGTFFLECSHKVQLAQGHLSKARDLSMGKDWNASSILGKAQEPVYKECSNYLCQALIASSKELRKNGKPEDALPLIHRSYKMCLESRSSRQDIQMETYFELGMTYRSLRMLDWAKMAFKRFIELAKLQNYPRSACDGYLALAITYRSENDLPRCHHCLVNYFETAEAHSDENLTAFAKRYLGEFHLNNGDAGVAAKFFQESFDSFHVQSQECLKIPINQWKAEHFTLPHDVELTRVLIGLANGELITKQICQLIVQARGHRGNMQTLKLIDWKNKKAEPFELAELKLADTNLGEDDDAYEDIRAVSKPGVISAEFVEDVSNDDMYYKAVRFADEGDAT